MPTAFLEREVEAQEAQEKLRQLQAHSQGLEEFYGMRKGWSRFLMVSLAVLIVFQCLMMVSIGRNWLVFSNYKTLLNIQAVEYFGQIVAMCFIIVKFLFNHQDSGSREGKLRETKKRGTPNKDTAAATSDENQD